MVPAVDTRPMNDDVSMDPIVPKSELAQDGHVSMSSSVSTPEPEEQIQDVAQTQKRKGGRKPIYATSEERKQRNRQAQAAFRERRTEYIKQLEATIKRNEESLQSLQQSHRSAADECLMLRYKNSLLERILMEKGIDVQAELRLKTGNSATLPPPSSAATNIAAKQPLPIDRSTGARAATQRRQAPGAIAPKPDHSALSQTRDSVYNAGSPQPQPTPSSHVSSPSTGRSPGFALQGAMSPKGTEFQSQQQRSRPPLLPLPRDFATQNSMGVNQMRQMDSYSATAQPLVAAGTIPPQMQPYYSAPFSKHYNQLEQEYDAQADMLDDSDPPENGSDAQAYVPDFNRPPVPTGQSRLGLQGPASVQSSDSAGVYNTQNPLFNQYEPVLDSDTFGLSASMHFQTPFSYEQEILRQ